jgi:hypothetical protein
MAKAGGRNCHAKTMMIRRVCVVYKRAHVMCFLGRERRRGKEQVGGGGENHISLHSCLLPAWLILRGLKLHRLRSI